MCHQYFIRSTIQRDISSAFFMNQAHEIMSQ